MMTKKTLLLLFSFIFCLQGFAQTSSWSNPGEVKRVQCNIEKYRKGDATITIVDKNGKPLRNATVIIQQQTHEFLFGSNLFVLHQLATPELNQKYESAFTHLFNFATIPFYWRELEPQQNHLRFKEGSDSIWRRPPPDELVKWCKAHGIVIKGHQLLYVKRKFMPDWISANDSNKLKALAGKRMTQLAERYGYDVSIWDAVNEEMARIAKPSQWDAVPHDFLSWAFKKADSLFPKRSQLIINDETKTSHYSTQDYVDMVNGLLKQNIRLDGIGIQFHMLQPDKFLKGEVYTPQIMHDAYKKLGNFGKPLWITEITIPTHGETGLQDQATIVSDIYKLWFSEPQMKGITWWNLGDGTAFGAENNFHGGLLDSAMNPKPSYKVLDQLINHDWKTNITLKTDADGIVNFRGFHGKYSIQVKKGNKSQKYNFQLPSNVKVSKATFKL
ncbi:glycoside hydrolase family 10 [Ginsengibacter hankyongi]|uniref:endo-1,4-beta-xylanase n=1 Tax=Ginsengibacter hankyongi TaxID=2607284 RepID=A0A5J5IGZ0_9BACT|nr:endo-1,4-beta-xylanase [Ginsengibacter hankyongi]KAA9038671.1 glycoside hydrolase family 10 [Ginsengibacter hankyongi]